MTQSLKRIALWSLLGSLVIVASACDFTEINTDPNTPDQVTAPLVLNAVQINFAYLVMGNTAVRIPAQWVQQLTWTGILPNSDSYDVNESAVNNLWEFYGYTQTIKNARLLVELAEQPDPLDAAGRTNPYYAGVGKIIEAWSLSVLTDLFGDIPYSDAFEPLRTTRPTYDRQEQIYETIFALLNAATVDLSRPAADNARPLSQGDLIYGGSAANWAALANSLKARFHMRLSRAPGRNESAQAQAALDALAAGALTGNAQNARMQYQAPTGAQNPWFQLAIRGVWDTRDQVSAHHINLLKTLRDPRLPVHARQRGAVGAAGVVAAFQPAPFNPDVHFDLEDQTYWGQPNASVLTGFGAAGTSSIGTFFSAPEAPQWLLTYASQKFVEAEATLIVSGAAAAQPIFEEAVRADMQRLGVPAASIAEYVGRLPVLTAENALEAIMTQKYIAGFLDTEPYNDFRRTDYPRLSPVPVTPARRIDIIPRRFPYPSSERARNEANIPAYVPLGFEALRVPVWWDTNPPAGSLPNPTQ
jgi:hypothetical protein